MTRSAVTTGHVHARFSFKQVFFFFFFWLNPSVPHADHDRENIPQTRNERFSRCKFKKFKQTGISTVSVSLLPLRMPLQWTLCSRPWSQTLVSGHCWVSIFLFVFFFLFVRHGEDASKDSTRSFAGVFTLCVKGKGQVRTTPLHDVAKRCQITHQKRQRQQQRYSTLATDSSCSGAQLPEDSGRTCSHEPVRTEVTSPVCSPKGSTCRQSSCKYAAAWQSEDASAAQNWVWARFRDNVVKCHPLHCLALHRRVVLIDAFQRCSQELHGTHCVPLGNFSSRSKVVANTKNNFASSFNAEEELLSGPNWFIAKISWFLLESWILFIMVGARNLLKCCWWINK